MVTRHYATAVTGQVHYRRAEPDRLAERPPLLMLHMSPASSLIYERFMVVMGRDRMCIAPDTPGYGNSDAPAAPPVIADYADAMVSVLDDLRIDGPLDVMGYHTGSMTAIELADRYPDRIRRVVIVSAPIFTQEELERFHSIYSTDPIWTPDGERLLALWHWFVEFFRVGTVNTVADAGRIFYERLSGREHYWYGHNAAFQYAFADTLSRVRQKILVLNPDDDLAAMTPRAEGLMLDGSIMDLPDFTHGFLDTHSEEVAAIVRSFLDA